MKRILSAIFLALLFVGPTLAQTAEEVIARHVEAVGGEEAWSEVENSHAKLSVSVEIPQGVIVIDVEAWTIYPGYAFLQQTPVSVPDGLPDLSSTVYISPEEAWAESFQGRQEMDPSSPQAAMGGNGMPSTASPLQELTILSMMQDSLSVELVGQEEIGGKTAHVIQIAGPVPSKRFYDVETGLLIAQEAAGPMGPVRMMISEYMDVDGLKVAMIQEGDMGPMGKQTIAMVEYVINQELTPEILAEMARGDQ